MRTQVAFALLLLVGVISASHPVAPFTLTSWSLSSSASFHQGRSESVLRDLSTTSSHFRDGAAWYNATGPATVMAALQQSNTFEDPYYADNIKKINASLFAVPWNYMTTFVLPAPMTDTVLLTFKGINYRADVWLNGHHVANSSTIIGTFRYFDIDITNHVSAAPAINTLLVQVTQPNDACFPPNNNSTDLAFTFVDWTYYPPDNSMGIWRDVLVSMVDGITVRYPAVTSVLSPDNDQAYLEVMAEVTNWLTMPMQGLLIAYIPEIGNFSQAVTLSPMQMLQVTFSNNTFAGLNVVHPELWWPWQMGEQHMYNFTLTFIRDDTKSVSDEQTAAFGIRQVNSFINSNGSRQYQVNGQNILIRGAGWSPDLFLVYNDTRLMTELSYVKWMGLNSVRLEGKMEPDIFFTFADQLGILVLPGWCCCDAWQHWQYWGPQQYFIAQESLRSQVKRMRIHPSVLVFLYSSDELPPAKAEAVYLTVFKDEPWPAAILAAASAANSTLSGPTGVKMSGPYSWVPPVYWLGDHTGQLGGAYGFLTEGGPGENPLPFESLQRTVKSSHLWPSANKEWNLHCGNPVGVFYDLRFFTPPLEARYGDALSAQDYSYKSQLAAYEGHRAMFEAYSRNKYMSTGVIQWMLNNAWPQMIWHLYDNYLNPGGSFFGTLKACEPLHIMYSYYDNTVWIVNSAYRSTGDLVATAAAYSLDATLLWQAHASVSSVGSDGVVTVPLLTVPELKNASTTYFLRLQIFESGALMSTNVYWLSTQADVLDWKDSNFYRTACTQYADFTALQTLPPVSLNVSSSISENYAVVTISNPTQVIALAVRVRLVGADGLDVAPVFWSDNYVTLWPDDEARLIATFDSSATPTLVIETYNSASKT